MGYIRSRRSAHVNIYFYIQILLCFILKSKVKILICLQTLFTKVYACVKLLSELTITSKNRLSYNPNFLNSSKNNCLSTFITQGKKMKQTLLGPTKFKREGACDRESKHQNVST